MSRRRREPPPDSLEMLLDTMCNTFGGIILIALLVSLLARDLKPVKSTANTPTTQSRLQDALQHARQAQVELAGRLADPRHTNIVALVQQREEIARQVEALRQRLEAAAQSADPALLRSNEQARVNELTRRNEQILQEIAETSRDTQAAENRIRDIERQKDGQVRQMRLPQESRDERRQWFIVARHGRLYPLHQYPDTPNTAMLDYRRESDDSIFTPKRDRGIDVGTDAAAFKTLMRQLPRERVLVAFLTYGDSYPAFNEARRIVLELGLGYGLRLMPDWRTPSWWEWAASALDASSAP